MRAVPIRLLCAAAWMPLACLAAPQGASPAQPPAQPAAQSPAPAKSDQADQADQAAQPAIDPDAMSALGAMGAYLRTLSAFEVVGRATTETVMDDGMKLQFDSTANLKVRRPDRLRVDMASDRKQRQLFYDGKTLTIYGQRINYYATVPAPPTLRETVDTLGKKYGIELPLADLFYWGTEQAPVSDIRAAHYIGPATVGSLKADHYAFRQEGVDWQVWIQTGKTPLPLKLAITASGQPGAPTHTSWLRWNIAPRFTDATFVFRPPPGALKIALQTADGKVASIK
ncbi:hypothetical protein ABIB38_001460 [Massilia sp. UYP11]|uniref:DUF2092 domain-containing protein n=1 Tax=Massilia sp. UYP11 TaxID=1756385 RepID=UPI003D200224